MATIIKLNVGGTFFDTTETTLQGSDFFKGLIRNRDTFTTDIENRYFIDRSGMAFEHVLNLLRDINYSFPEEYLGELDFYGIAEPINIRPSNDKLSEKIKKNES